MLMQLELTESCLTPGKIRSNNPKQASSKLLRRETNSYKKDLVRIVRHYVNNSWISSQIGRVKIVL